MNHVTLIGNITKDIELSQTKTGKIVTQFNIGVRRNEESSDFPYCIAWGKTAELLKKYCHKGSKIGIEGSLQTSSFEKNGKKSYTTIVCVSRIELLGSKQGTEVTPAPEAAVVENTEFVNVGDFPGITSDDLPF